ncbi:MAG: acyl-CoA synthetase (AMP-forming)/AMP-acid ligase II [Arenicella sp.]
MGGLIAIPLYPPINPKSVQRLTKIVADSQASIALTSDKLSAELDQESGDNWGGASLKFVSLSEVAKRSASVDYNASFKRCSIAFLQYTSGSTGDPKGVIISQQNVIANIRAATTATGAEAGDTFCSWLPLHHDMGMVVSILTPLYLGGHSVIMSPTRFIRRPRRWLEAISQHQAVITASPNFAFDLCVDRITDDSVADLDLSRWRVAINGAEPLNAETIGRFVEKFSAIGFSDTTMYPA